MHFSFIATCALFAGVIAAPALSSKRHVVHERRERLPAGWRKEAKSPSHAVLPMRFGLSQSNLDRADEFLMDVSHPSSPNFGKHWSPQQIAETFAPTEEAINAILDWLTESGIDKERIKLSPGMNWVNANLTVTEAESLLQTKYWHFIHVGSGTSHVACDDYSIPDDIRKHIDLITPTVHFDARISKKKQKRSLTSREAKLNARQTLKTKYKLGTSIGNPGDGSLPKAGGAVAHLNNDLANCDVSIVPDCLRALYKIPIDYPVAASNSYGIVEYTPQAYLPSDLDLFFANFSPALVGSRPEFESIDGGLLQTIVEDFNYNGESDLDLEYSMALVYPQSVTLYQVGDIFEGASFNNFLDALDGSYCTYEGGDDVTEDGVYPDPYGSGYGFYSGSEACGGFAAANVISTSYGYNEADLTAFYEMRQCYEYMKLGLQGVTFLYSSGDYGVAGNSGECIDPTTGAYNNGTRYSRSIDNEPLKADVSVGTSGMFVPSFPGGCPYVTSVGATQVKPNATVTQPEEAAESVIYSGGGFSNVFGLPSYQAEAVATYFAKHSPPYGADQYNNSQTSRGFPDVAANGVNYVIAIDGAFSYVYGTSASSPTFGSVMTLINAARLNAGKSPVGFINPVLYTHPHMLNDITEGGNQGCGTAGFTAVKGWDPVTGLGTPDFTKMVEVWLALP
ncbi:putative tripeptidyl-peptidase 1 [Coleophoma cylindrospora]|uniref:tripeptidyl-peptidase II n=1 Tax=Coleophoma cylindrospora TaxID=1849047 RepID=A0A3D8SF16_9HELO|nr:putative tripeptidyl-peptidase 1 [Coleophoma cylindrospora]